MMVMMMVATLHYTDKLFNGHEYHYTAQYVQTNKHLSAVVMGVLMASAASSVLVTVVMVTVSLTMVGVVMGVKCMRNQVQESITQQSSGCKAEEYLEQRRVLVCISERDEEQNEEWCSADESGGKQGIQPHHMPVIERFTVIVFMAH